MKTVSRMALFVSTLALTAALSSQAAVAQLGGANNQILSNDCKPIMNLTVAVHADEDIVGPKGIGIQLNAASPPSPPGTTQQGPPAAWQQYMMGIGPSPHAINWAIENWPISGNSLFFAPSTPLVSMPNNTLPKGYTLTIVLLNTPNGNVIGANFLVQNAQGAPVVIWSQPLELIAGASPQDLAPINAFQVNIVGPTGGQVLSQGSGTITYTATTPMTVGNGYPGCVASQAVTLETANTVYDPLPTGKPRKTFTQTFHVNH